MNKIKALLLSAAVVFAIGGAYATTDPEDPCETEEHINADTGLPAQAGYDCTNVQTKVCTYVIDPFDMETEIPCRWGDYIPPPQN